MKKYKLLGLCLALTMGGSLVSCDSNDDAPSLDTKVYINTENIPVNFIHAGDLVQNNVTNKLIVSVHEIKFPVRITMPYSRDVQVQLGINPDLLVAYNKEHGTDYTLLNKEALNVKNTTVTIPKGAMQSSDSLSITIADASKIGKSTSDFALPITITSVTNRSDLKISTNQYFVLATVKQSEINVAVVNAAPGVVVDHTKWVAISAQGPTFTDGDLTTTAGSPFNSGKQMTYDLRGDGEDTYKGFSITSGYGGFAGYDLDPARITFEISNDGTAWQSLGTANMARPTAPKDVNSPFIQYVQFPPFKANYIRFTFIGEKSVSNGFVLFSELNLYK